MQIPNNDGGVAGVIEVGSRFKSFESSVSRNLASRILALLVMMIVVYLAYAELRGCVGCLFTYRESRKTNARDAVAILTRPFTFCITLLINVDGVMAVLIARDILTAMGLSESSALIALPSIMLGIGMVLGQALYGWLGSRIDLRRLVVGCSIALISAAMLLVLAVAFNSFWAYCVTKLLLAIPFGLLYALGYSLPRMVTSKKSAE